MNGPASSAQYDAGSLVANPRSKTTSLGAGGKGKRTVVLWLFTLRHRSDEISHLSHSYGAFVTNIRSEIN